MESVVVAFGPELRHHTPLTHAVKAADELFYAHNKRLYSGGIKPEYGLESKVASIKPQSASASEKSGEKSKKGNRGSTGAAVNSTPPPSSVSSKLKESIEAAKQTITKALTRDGGEGDNNVDSAAFMALQREVKTLKLENKQMRSDIAALQETLKKVVHTVHT